MFDTRQMYPGAFEISEENMIVNLIPDATQCKAINRGGSCGTTATGEQCCAPSTESKTEIPKIELKNLVGKSNRNRRRNQSRV